jgi:hypothetical protein
MIPRPGEIVRLTKDIIKFLEDKYGNFPQVMERLNEVRDRNFEVLRIESSEFESDYQFVVFDYKGQGLHLDKDGCWHKSDGVIALEYVGASSQDDCCPDCGHAGQVVGMACICQNPSCSRHTIWGI